MSFFTGSFTILQSLGRVQPPRRSGPHGRKVRCLLQPRREAWFESSEMHALRRVRSRNVLWLRVDFQEGRQLSVLGLSQHWQSNHWDTFEDQREAYHRSN